MDIIKNELHKYTLESLKYTIVEDNSTVADLLMNFQ